MSEEKLNAYLKSGEYLPDFMRDFHDQKTLFKRLDKIVQNRNDGHGIDWINAQIYSVDVFLWYMAFHGYTLQKSRKKVQFGSIESDLSSFEKEQMELRANVLKSFLKSKEE